MINPRFILFGILLVQFAYQGHAMYCDGAYNLECPTVLNSDNKVFCCYSNIASLSAPYCCDLGDYIHQNSAIIAGIVVGIIVVLIVCTLCCCCFCSCCLLAKRRQNTGRVLYAPVAPLPVVQSVNVPPPAYFPSSYPPQSSTMVHPPPPTYPASQPPLNPHYKG